MSQWAGDVRGDPSVAFRAGWRFVSPNMKFSAVLPFRGQVRPRIDDYTWCGWIALGAMFFRRMKPQHAHSKRSKNFWLRQSAP